jgi:molybdopterin-guanine dinucleotide biosynthesis protein A
MEDVTGVVLAGGESRRFGNDEKALARLDGDSLIERVVSVMTTVTDSTPLIAVQRPDQRERLTDAIGEEPRFVQDSVEFQGPVAGLAAAARAAETPWLFVCGCDMPLLSADAIRWLGSYRDREHDAVVLEVSGKQPLHSFYQRTAVLDVLESLPTQAGLHALLAALPTCRTVQASAAPEDIPVKSSIVNVNTKQELASLGDQ